MEHIEHDIAARLTACGIGVTRQRVLIAGALLSRCAHWSADQLLAKINESQPEVSKATVYNTLRLFVDHGLAREVIVDPDRVFYDSNPEPHHHFYDVTRGELMDIPHDSIQLAKLPPLPAGCEMEGVEVVLRIRSRA
jgi:Fur family iron response transcriptional regulator